MQVKWEFFNMTTGVLENSGDHYIGKKSTRTVGPGLNNHTISLLKKGEQVTIISNTMNLKAVYTPETYKGAVNDTTESSVESSKA